ncbi:N-acetylglutamate synthase-like GNAT family acetyltransferase [Deinococcus metalli]|uniref:N-acetylglutamate synthase-like GNAT family acetyltransferase n=1 Tax=Deinococcus metalli TaxID=1141878 RepID=A0A7W8NPK2_9DEIO|nr:arsenic resistance N-acetyltransferase ArsN2 [Deinococcus metalli]MBB5378064.1 N-acetylglutamate synthase-like GNAT family acetyltransferase [Deinococcus metalli]GHF54149.1 hypothetical protein GCM10017781_33050 [Deinococcus metalli]
MLIRSAELGDLLAISALLSDLGLPSAGIEEHLSGMRVTEKDGVVALAGLETHGTVGLLRSVAVTPGEQGQGLAARLVREVLDAARQQHLDAVYLLTTTAETYFPRFGFTPVPRSAAPAALLASREFQDACPATATLMRLPLKEPTMTRTIPGLTDQTSTAALTGALRAPSQRPLEFWLQGRLLIGPGYHVTEVKAVSIEAMDCGGQAASWRETVIQLMDGSAQEAVAGFMTTRKFLAIYDRVTRRIPVRDEAEVRFEYGNATTPAMQYHVSHIEAQDARVIVHLRTPGVQCKAGDACGEPAATAQGGSCAPASSCCTPVAADLITLG